MQCTSYIPVYSNERDLERGCNVSVPRYTMEQYLGYEKDVMRRIIQNHEATFRYQVQELHRLYTKQSVLMNEISVGEIFTQSSQLQTSKSNLCSSQAWPHISQASHTASWLIRDRSDSKLSVQSSEYVLELSKGHDKRVCNVELPADLCNNDEEIQPENDSKLGFAKTSGYLLSSNTSSCKTKFLIDLNEPVQVESVDDTISSVDIDLNSMPHSLSDTASNVENLQNIDNDAKDGNQDENLHPLNEKLDCDSGIVFSSENAKPSRGIDEKVLKNKSHIDLNTGTVIDEPFPPHPSTNLETKCTTETELKAPVSPENKEASPPRGKSRDITPMLSELDRIAANTLIMIFDSAKEQLGNFCNNPLTWFAEIVSSTENEVIKLQKSVKKGGKTGSCSRRGSAKVRKNSKLDGAIWKKLATRSVLKDWGNVKKRRGGRKCRASKFFVIS